MSLLKSVDWKRYYRDNPELQEDFDYSPEKCYRHYLRYGRKQGKKITYLSSTTQKPTPNVAQQVQRQTAATQRQSSDRTQELLQKYSASLKSFRSLAPPVHVVTRTHRRASLFAQCRTSILEQTYPNIVHWVLYDDKRSKAYLPVCRRTRRLFVKPTSERFGYNRYLNAALEQIDTGWVLVLDDDDCFTTPNAVDLILDKARKDCVVFWYHRFGKAQKTYSEDIRDIPTCFAFSASNKDLATWSANDFASGEVAFSLLSRCKRAMVEHTLTGSITAKARNFGKSADEM
jgi:hypothetical protein